MKIGVDKKGTELSLQTIVILVIGVIALIVIIYFIVTNYTQNSNTVTDIGKSAIEQAANS